MDAIVDFVVTTVGQWGYTGIVVMMALESSFVPFPSEVVMIPAGFLAFKGEMNIWLAIACGLFGSWFGALVNYYMAVYLGRPFLLKWGKYFFINEKKFVKTEKFFVDHGEIGTFVGRLIPVVRQYISFPAGLARMNLPRFLFFTGLGAGIWVTILAWIGYFAGQKEELWREYTREATIIVILACAVLVTVYTIVHLRKKRRAAALAQSAPPPAKD